MSHLWIRIVLILCGAFDGVVGIVFFAAPAAFFH